MTAPSNNADDRRKELERDLHDHLRGDAAADPASNSNKKFYAISTLNRRFVENWLLERIRGRRVLDYCSGDGDFSIWLAKNGAHVDGIDISEVSIDNSRQKAAGLSLSGSVTFHVMDAEALDFPDRSFDYAVVNGVLHHLDLDRAYAELSRVLRVGGEVIATEALRHNPVFAMYRRRTPHLRSAWEAEHILGRNEINRARRFFGDVELLSFFHLTTLAAVPFRGTPLFGPLLRSLSAIDRRLMRSERIRWFAWMAVFRLASPIPIDVSDLAAD